MRLVNRGTIMAADSTSIPYDNQNADGIDAIINYGVMDGVISTGTASDTVSYRDSGGVRVNLANLLQNTR